MTQCIADASLLLGPSASQGPAYEILRTLSMRVVRKLHKAGRDTHWGRFCNLSKGGRAFFYFVIVTAVTNHCFINVLQAT